MDLLLCRSLWGLEDDPDRFVDALASVRDAGYDAVSCPVQLVPDDGRFAEGLEATGLRYLPSIHTFGATVEEHIEMLDAALDRCHRFEPLRVLVQAGRDAWDEEVASSFMRHASRAEQDSGLTVAHETHRGRVLSNPWRARRLLERHPDIVVSADLSHWVVVAERLKIGREEVELVAERAVHIDARVGWEEGPQVPDPELDAFVEHRATFWSWWDLIWKTQERRGATTLSITPEYGPAPYQPVDPFSGDPLRPLAEIVDEQARRLRARFEAT